ncbi:hypothetical protein GCM10009623_35450 [Nocardioides aestuarii]|uniref:Cytochrome c oxidase assembly protein n=1 Tax=Nocardioides aestuarii TaxID=252231 RepID=A0ABW4TU28_9ACTN
MPGPEHPYRWVAPAAGAGLLAWWAALTLAGGAPLPPVPGLPDAGPVVTWGARGAGLGLLPASVVTVGSLVVALLLPDTTQARTRAVRAAGVAAAAWGLLLVAEAALSRAEAAGTPIAAIRPAELVTGLAPGAVGLLLGQLVGLALLSWRARRSPDHPGVLVAVALGVAAAGAAEGHATGPGEMLGGAVVVHVVAALVWTGGLVGVVLHLRDHPRLLADVLPRYSTLAAGCFVALAGSGALAATLTLGSDPSAWRSGYAQVVGLKLVVLAAAGACGAAHRRWTLRAVRRGRPRAFLRLATGELVLMAAAGGLAAALARTPPPAPAGTSAAGHGHLTSTADLGWSTVWSASRPDPVAVVLLVGLGAWYLRTVAGLRRQGAPWPRARTASFVTGLTAALVVTCSGIGPAAHALPSALLGQLLTLLLAVPALLLGGRPWELPGAPTAVMRWQPSPRTGALVVVGLLLALEHIPAVTLALGSPWWHLVLLALAVAAGTLLWWPWLGPDASPDGPAERLGWSASVVVALAVLALRIGPAESLLAPGWYLEQRLAGADLPGDAPVAGTVVAVAAGCYLMALLLVSARALRVRPPAPAVPAATPERGRAR